MIGVGIFAAETDAAAERLFTSSQLQFLSMLRGRPGKLPPPVASMAGLWSPAEQVAVQQRTRYAAVGSLETVRRRLQEIIAETGADEIIATAQIYEHAARLRSFEIASELLRDLVRQKSPNDHRNPAAAAQ